MKLKKFLGTITKDFLGGVWAGMGTPKKTEPRPRRPIRNVRDDKTKRLW